MSPPVHEGEANNGHKLHNLQNATWKTCFNLGYDTCIIGREKLSIWHEVTQNPKSI